VKQIIDYEALKHTCTPDITPNPSTLVIIWENELIEFECNHMRPCQKLTHVRHTFCQRCSWYWDFFFGYKEGQEKRDYITTKQGVAIPKTSATNK